MRFALGMGTGHQSFRHQEQEISTTTSKPSTHIIIIIIYTKSYLFTSKQLHRVSFFPVHN